MTTTDQSCVHNQRAHFTHGFLCEDCGEFFSKESAVYRSTTYLSDLWMALHNVNAEDLRAGGTGKPEAVAMRDKVGIGVQHNNYEELISEAEAVLAKLGSHGDAATIVLKP